MTISINISVLKQEHVEVKPILIDSAICTVAELQEKIAQQLGIKVADMTAVEITLNPAKKMAVLHRQQLTLSDMGISDRMQISVAIAVSKMIELPQDNRGLSGPQARSKVLEEERKNMSIAQERLKRALNNAENEGAHVIVTVGSYMNQGHGEGSLARQQFPVDRLKGIAPEAPVHLIHIDPGFKNLNGDPVQFHEQAGWELIDKDPSDLVCTYTKDNYTITTIAHEIVVPSEGAAYFEGTGNPQSVLNINLSRYLLRAEKAGRGFITGNFYDPTATPVIQITPRPLEPQLEEAGMYGKL